MRVSRGAKATGWRGGRGGWLGALLGLGLGVAGCGGETEGPAPTPVDAKPAVESHVAVVRANYADALATATALRGAVDAFVAAPSAATLEAARKAWLDARGPYGESEVYRFYGGPIDDDDGPEGRINAWPLDEAYIDYVEGDETAGIINRPDEFPEITKELIASKNEAGGEKNISSGYHAIEFLLWGQDKSATGPGARPHTDYLTGDGATAANQARRGQYLALAAELLVDDLTSVTEAWADADGTYARTFAADPQAALANMLTGMGSLAGAELANERMNNALQEQDQEEEHSCFSDNTHADLRANAVAVENVYLGRYGDLDGVGIDELVRAKDPALDDRLKADLAAALAAVDAVPVPFDAAIASEDGRARVQAAVDALKALTPTIVEVATALGVTLNLEG